MPRRDPFLLDPEVVFLNHGSFGSCPQPVFDVYQQWQREFEREPVDLFERRLEPMLAEVRTALGPGDEILTTAHEYDGIDRLLRRDQPLQMASFRQPSGNAEEIDHRLFEEFGIEVRVTDWDGQALLRVSIAPYKVPEDLDRLTEALTKLF